MQKAISDRLAYRIGPELTKVFAFDRQFTFDAHVVLSYSAEGKHFFGAHRDNGAPTTADRAFAVSLNLNDDFEGGELVFPEYAGVRVSPPAGGAAVFSCSLLHQALPVTRGRRFVLTTFLPRQDVIRTPATCALADPAPRARRSPAGQGAHGSLHARGATPTASSALAIAATARSTHPVHGARRASASSNATWRPGAWFGSGATDLSRRLDVHRLPGGLRARTSGSRSEKQDAILDSLYNCLPRAPRRLAAGRADVYCWRVFPRRLCAGELDARLARSTDRGTSIRADLVATALIGRREVVAARWLRASPSATRRRGCCAALPSAARPAGPGAGWRSRAPAG